MRCCEIRVDLSSWDGDELVCCGLSMCIVDATLKGAKRSVSESVLLSLARFTSVRCPHLVPVTLVYSLLIQ